MVRVNPGGSTAARGLSVAQLLKRRIVMSNVTNLILSIGHFDAEADKIVEVNRYFEEPEIEALRCRGLVAIDDPALPEGWYGGSKYFEAYIYLGAFNYLLLDEFIEYVRSIQWQSPESVQLVVMEQEDDRFRIIDVFSPK
jgi:hypothetical protein